MDFVRRFIQNHVLANLSFGLILVLGVLSFIEMPVSRDPDINFNWINITTVLPGASSIEVEKRITDPIEDTISRTAKDLRYISSTSRDSVSSILVRFNQLSTREFDKRVADLRREVQNVYTDQLPSEASDPTVTEITSSSGFPTAIIALTSESNDEGFRRYSASLKKELERIKGVDSTRFDGIGSPELRIEFYPERLEGMGITPVDLANTVRGYFFDVSMGDIDSDDGRWIVRLEGTGGSLEDIENFPIVGAQGVVSLGSLADIYRAEEEPMMKASFEGKRAVMISVTKQEGVNILEILDDLREFIEHENRVAAGNGYQLQLIDDQTVSTEEAISLMQNNALIGLFFVVLVTFLFLGGRIAFLTSIGIPFTLAGTFLVLSLLGMSVNNLVLLGIVIALGMLVDDAVVVVEAIYYRLQQGQRAVTAVMSALREVASPVFTSVMTTVAVFLPLMLLPGIMGEFMKVIPIVVCVALLISLLEAFWILPAHVMALKVDFTHESSFQKKRRTAIRKIRHKYCLILIKAMRWPWVAAASVVSIVILAFVLLQSGALKINFFASDPFRLLYINADLPNGSSLDKTLEVAEALEQEVLEVVFPEELRASITYSGQQFTDTDMRFGDHLGQVFLSVNPASNGMRSIDEIVNALNTKIGKDFKGASISVLMLQDGPPVGQAISVKVRGKSFEEIQAAADKISSFITSNEIFSNMTVDFKLGNPEMRLSLNGDAIKRAGIPPSVVTNSLQSYVDGSLINQYQYLGEEVDVRLLAKSANGSVDSLLQQTIADEQGNPVMLGELVDVEYGYGYQNIRHYKFQRAITVSSDLDTSKSDTVTANNILKDYWESISLDHPGITLDFSGELDDINESLDGMLALFAMGIGLIYLILGTQFKSYLQPVLVLVSVPLAFTGVVFGLVITANPLSLMTLYGVVALSGISVNAAIVLISAANDRRAAGMSLLHSTIYAARRRVIPILITSFTTIAGLFSLAAGFAGKSLVWGPVATAIVSGLIFSTVLILIVVPLLYRGAEVMRHRDWSKFGKTKHTEHEPIS